MMKIIAFSIMLLLMSYAIHLRKTGKIDYKDCRLFVVIAFIVPIVMLNVEVIKAVNFWVFGFETYRQEVTTIKNEALEEIRGKVEDHKKSISLLISNAEDTRKKIDFQRQAVESLIELVKKTELSVQNQAQAVDTLNKQVEKTKSQVEKLHMASEELSLLLVKITWLQLETKSEVGTERHKVAVKNIARDVDKILQVIVPDPHARAEWLKELYQSIPPRQR